MRQWLLVDRAHRSLVVPAVEWVRRTVVVPLTALPAYLAVAAGCAVSAMIAAALALVTSEPAHRSWGLLATAGYVVAGVIALHTRRAVSGLRAAAAGSVLMPTVILVVAGTAQPEVGVIERSARVLALTGSPYLANPVTVDDVNPYLPAMSFFGVPRLLLPSNGLGDSRWWFLLVFVATLVAAYHVARRGHGSEPVLWAVLACPAVGLPAAAGGHDLPVIGLLCLSLALAARGRASVAGLALGAACALKWSAWPALAVVVALVAIRYGRKHALRCGFNAVAVVVGTVLPVLVGPTARAAIAQVGGFPMGTTEIESPADAPTPGVLLANGGTVARIVGLALLAVIAAAFAARLITRTPRTLTGATGFLALALGVAALVMPTSRAGYILYPTVLAAFALWVRTPQPAWGVMGHGNTLVPAVVRSGDGGI